RCSSAPAVSRRGPAAPRGPRGRPSTTVRLSSALPEAHNPRCLPTSPERRADCPSTTEGDEDPRRRCERRRIESGQIRGWRRSGYSSGLRVSRRERVETRACPDTFASRYGRCPPTIEGGTWVPRLRWVCPPG